jgi:hypothetical protein
MIAKDVVISILWTESLSCAKEFQMFRLYSQNYVPEF